MPSSNLTDLERLFNNSIGSMDVYDVYGCKEQDLTSSQVSSWIRVLGLFWGCLGQLAVGVSHVEGCRLPLNILNKLVLFV